MLSPRRRYLLGAIACFTVLVAGLLWLLAPQSTTVKPYPLARFSLPDLRDPTDGVIRFGGPRERPLVLNFFFSDCVGCVEELPRIEQASKKWAGKVDVIGIDHFEPRASGLGIVRSTGVSFPVAWDETGEFAPRVFVNAFPATLFIDNQGMIRRRVLGQISTKRLNHEIEVLFSAFHAN